MQNTNIQEQPRKPNRVLEFAKWFGVWVVVYAAFGIYGGLFAPGPQDIPAGMTWLNSADASSSTFYMLRDGQHLILELNRHSQMFWAILFTLPSVGFLYVCSKGIQGKLKNKKDELFPRYGQVLIALLLLVAAAADLGYGGWRLLQKETLDLDPVADSVLLDGEHIGRFQEVAGFRFYASPMRKGTKDYFIYIQFHGKPEIQIGGGNAQGDVDQVADYLNAYLAEVRRHPTTSAQ